MFFSVIGPRVSITTPCPLSVCISIPFTGTDNSAKAGFTSRTHNGFCANQAVATVGAMIWPILFHSFPNAFSIVLFKAPMNASVISPSASSRAGRR